jgi:hypothetical protein
MASRTITDASAGGSIIELTPTKSFYSIQEGRRQ